MTAAQTRIAESLEIFYGSADRASEGAMAGHAYKRSVDDLDGGFGRELVGTQLDTPSPRLEWTPSRTSPIGLRFRNRWARCVPTSL
jgi:hypothetical protein